MRDAQTDHKSIMRTIALDSTDGIIRGQEVEDTGAPIMVPVGLRPSAAS